MIQKINKRFKTFQFHNKAKISKFNNQQTIKQVIKIYKINIKQYCKKT